jgi:hypothetical protein
MNPRIQEIINQITELETEVEALLRKQQEHILYRLKDGRIRFDKEIESAQRKMRQGVLRWLLDSRPRNLLSAPFIYGMIVPLVLLDLGLFVYQSMCFPLYRVARVRRGDYLVFDRHHLQHLNIIEKLNCLYCGYANGLIAYAREIASRTEQYWCPIKHAARIHDRHSRYMEFIDYGDAENYHARARELRERLRREPRGS